MASDLKLINILLGISTHGGKYSCPWCDGEAVLKSGNLRSFGDIDNCFRQYADAGFPEKQMMNFKNVVKPCLIKVDDPKKLVISVIPLPELHLLMGLVNHICNYIIPLWAGLKKWVNSLGVIRKGYHGGTYDGNVLRAILKNVDSLALVIPIELFPLIDTLRKFDRVVTGTFSEPLDPQYHKLIQDFTDSFEHSQTYCSEVIMI
nr:uncharacterized protein LOC105843228 [Hydra vulgaris]